MATQTQEPKVSQRPKRRRRRKTDTVSNAVEVCKIATGELEDNEKPPVENTILHKLMREENEG